MIVTDEYIEALAEFIDGLFMHPSDVAREKIIKSLKQLIEDVKEDNKTLQ